MLVSHWQVANELTLCSVRYRVEECGMSEETEDIAPDYSDQ